MKSLPSIGVRRLSRVRLPPPLVALAPGREVRAHAWRHFIIFPAGPDRLRWTRCGAELRTRSGSSIPRPIPE
jgi:hypothetical protein